MTGESIPLPVILGRAFIADPRDDLAYAGWLDWLLENSPDDARILPITRMLRIWGRELITVKKWGSNLFVTQSPRLFNGMPNVIKSVIPDTLFEGCDEFITPFFSNPFIGPETANDVEPYCRFATSGRKLLEKLQRAWDSLPATTQADLWGWEMFHEVNRFHGTTFKSDLEMTGGVYGYYSRVEELQTQPHAGYQDSLDSPAIWAGLMEKLGDDLKQKLFGGD